MIKHKPIEDYLLRNSNVERARENTFLKHAYEELAVELGDTCPICNKFVDDVDDHIDKIHGGTQKTLFEEAFGKPYQVSGGWEELDPPRYPHSKLPKEFVGDERNLTEDFSEEFFDTADIMEEYDNIPTDNMKHQTQNLQNTQEDLTPDQQKHGDFVAHLKDSGYSDDEIENLFDFSDYRVAPPETTNETLPEQDGTFYTHDGKAEDWDIPYYKVPDNYYTDKGDEQSNYLKDTRHEERDMLKGYGVADKTLHELGLDELEEGKVGDATIDVEKWLETRGEEDIVHDADMYDKVKDLGYDEDTADKVAFKAEEGAHGSGRRGHEQWMNPTEIIDKKTDEDLRRDNFIARAEEIIEDFKPEFTSEQLLKTDCSNCSQKSYDKIFKAFEDK